MSERTRVAAMRSQRSVLRCLNCGVLAATLSLGGSAAVLLQPAEAFAQEAPAEPLKVAVGTFGGAKGTSARGWVIEGLQGDERFDPMEDDLGLSDKSSEAQIAEKALSVEADVVIVGRGIFGKGWSAEVRVHDGKDGHLIEKVKVKGPSWAQYEAALVGGTGFFSVATQAVGFPPPEPEPEPEVVEEEPEEEEPVAEEEVETRPSPLDVSPGMRLYGRAFRYTDTKEQLAPGDGHEPLDDYSLDAAPMATINAHWYPGAHFTDGVMAHIGLTGGYERGFATKVNDAANDRTLNQAHQLWYVGGRGRIPVGPALFGVGANYGGHLFELKDPDGGDIPFPGVNYQFLEFQLDAEVVLGKVILGGQAGYLLILDPGEIGTDAWFPNASATGWHLGGYTGWRFSPVVDAIVGVDSRAYGFDFNPVPVGDPDAPVAGGATDRYLSASFALRFRIPEKGGKSAGGASESEADSGGGDDFDSFD